MAYTSTILLMEYWSNVKKIIRTSFAIEKRKQEEIYLNLCSLNIALICYKFVTLGYVVCSDEYKKNMAPLIWELKRC